MRLCLLWLLCCFASASAHAQSVSKASPDHPQFEVTTVKASDPTVGAHHQGWSIEGQHVNIRYQTVASLMMFAYGIHPKQIADAPAWVKEDRWDVQGVADLPGEATHPQLQEMLKGLLADRFGLVLRVEKREMPAYTVSVAKGGEKLTITKQDLSAQVEQDAGQDAHGVWLRMKNVNMEQFCLYLQFFVDRPVVDRTGLQGRYDTVLRWKGVIDEATAADDYPHLPQAAEEQLGLKLTPQKDNVDTFVILKVEHPSAN